MSLRTYDRTSDLTGNALPWPFVCIEHRPDSPEPALQPGMWVNQPGMNTSGLGMVVAIDEVQITILWSVEPSWTGILKGFPLIRRLYSPIFPSSVVSIQPMTIPFSSSIFYFDYVYTNKMNKRCTTGPWPLQVFWRGVKWARGRMASCRSMLRSLKRRIKPNKKPKPSQLTDAEYLQSVVNRWNKRLR